LTIGFGDAGTLTQKDASELAEAYRLYSNIQQGTRLAGETVSPQDHMGIARLLERLVDQGDITEIATAVSDTAQTASDIIDKHLKILGGAG